MDKANDVDIQVIKMCLCYISSNSLCKNNKAEGSEYKCYCFKRDHMLLQSFVPIAVLALLLF